jgi:hypothetical protein
MGIQAREIVRFAKRNGMVIRRGGTATLRKAEAKHTYLQRGSCALSILSSMHGQFGTYDLCDEQNDVRAKCLPGITNDDLYALESGFEGLNGNTTDRYYRVGRNVAKMAGVMLA